MNTCSMSATKFLEMTEDNRKEDIFGWVVVIFDVKLSFQFVMINFTFSLLSVFMLSHTLLEESPYDRRRVRIVSCLRHFYIFYFKLFLYLTVYWYQYGAHKKPN